MSAFDRLSPALQYQIANALGFRALRPVQEQTIEAVTAGEDAIVLAPTAGGKTEAAFFPVLSRMDTEDWRPVSVIYLSPIRALLNNQEDRIARYAGVIGRRVFKWHGDVGQSARKAFKREPADIVLTTPESLEAMMLSENVPVGGLFAGLHVVIVDEIHAFAADDRGSHLACVLERLQRFAGRDIQRIGLSATVGNPDEILRWVRGSSKRPGRVVDPGGARAEATLSLDYVASIDNAARVIQQLHPGKKRLVFVDSRRKAEEIGKQLGGLGVSAFVSHGSLSATERREAERAFATGRDCAIVATSALELGIDVGDLDHVLQIDAPGTVASFLQRMGRTGRREGTRPNCTFLCTTDKMVLQAAALLRLYREGFVESVRPSRRAAHILAHQLMSLGVQQGGVPIGDWWAWLDGATPFADLSAAERAAVVAHMLSERILADQDGRLWLGPEGERIYGRANFRKLYAAFESPRLITVRVDTYEVGTVDAQFLSTLDSGSEPASFVLAGKAWRVVTIDWDRGICIVRPEADGRAARWAGYPRHLGYELCQAMRRALLDTEEDGAWSGRAREVLRLQRAEHAFLADAECPMLSTPEEITWWTFAGGAANVLLGRMFEHALGGQVIARNTSLSLRGTAGTSLAAVRDVVAEWHSTQRPTREDALAQAAGAARHRVSKFEPCLPPELHRELLAGRLLDWEGAAKTVGKG